MKTPGGFARDKSLDIVAKTPVKTAKERLSGKAHDNRRGNSRAGARGSAPQGASTIPSTAPARPGLE